ncbi:MAG: SAM-dependent methyltransferase [Pigmentiphaga sp.]|nr:SAM-dependent methyltransferase [Pigmentiphaga sp.]
MPTPPTPGPEVLAQAAEVETHLRQILETAGGWLGFDAFMHEALYAPGLGYYAAGSRKLAAPTDAAGSSDFITAPELSPWFGHTLAGPVADILHASGSPEVLEIGAGTGALAASLIPALRTAGLEVRYAILEVSADLRQRQQERLAGLGANIEWRDTLPDDFAGCVVANEVLDAMPVRLFRWSPEGTVLERGVAWHDGWQWQDRPADAGFAAQVRERMPPLPGYVSEINLQAEGWIQGLGRWLRRGGALFIDYGFPRHEYYHPQRLAGTLMCHFRHTANDNPLWLPGVQDITAHVDFTAMADAALAGSLEVLGYTSQAAFLLDAGLLQHLDAWRAQAPADYLRELDRVQKLVSEAEMGELFKVLAVGRGIDTPRGFGRDRSHTL